ncbi:hypothetical protein [Aquirhabdus sp.]|uniref:hypothetical protein n=1 Tax=Aquirhabdus sp. TaxID=2824160 RepID=UPI00396C4B85
MAKLETAGDIGNYVLDLLIGRTIGTYDAAKSATEAAHANDKWVQGSKVAAVGADIIGFAASVANNVTTESSLLTPSIRAVSKAAPMLGFAASIVGTARQIQKGGYGSVGIADIEGVIGAGLAVAAVTVAAPEIALALGIAAAVYTVAGFKDQGTIDALKNNISGYFNSLSQTDQASFNLSFSNAFQNTLEGASLVPKIDSTSGLITGYSLQKPISTTPQSNGSVVTTFDGGAKYTAYTTPPQQISAAGSTINGSSAIGSWTLNNNAVLGVYSDNKYALLSNGVVATSTSAILTTNNSTILVGKGTTSTVIGDKNTIQSQGNSGSILNAQGKELNIIGIVGSSSLKLYGDASSAIIDGKGSTISSYGNSQTITAWNQTINFGWGNMATTVKGDNLTINEWADSGSSLALSGIGHVVHGITGSTSLNLYGDGSSVAVDGGGSKIGVFGNNQSITAWNQTINFGWGNMATTVKGDNLTINEWANSGSSLALSGNGHVVHGITGSTAMNLFGDGSSASVFGDGGSIGLMADNQTIYTTGNIKVNWSRSDLNAVVGLIDSSGMKVSDTVYAHGVKTQEDTYVGSNILAESRLFNAAGKLTDKISYDYNGFQSKDEIYDPNTGKLTSSIKMYYGSPEVVEHYDSAGNTTQVDVYAANATRTGVIIHSIQTYTSTGNPIATTLYDAYGRKTEEVRYDPTQNFRRLEDTLYNSAGQVTSDKKYDIAGRLISDGTSSPTSSISSLPRPNLILSFNDGTTQLINSTLSTLPNLPPPKLKVPSVTIISDQFINKYYYPNLASSCINGVDPIILNLQGKPVETQSLSASFTYFDMQNNGQAVQTGWATAGEGMLVYNPSNPDGAVTQDSQLVAGFSVLQGMDSNSDGVFNSQDQAWKDMRVWITDGTGHFNAGQLHSLDQLGIKSINLNSSHVNQDNNGNTILDNSTFTWANGMQGEIAGVNLAFNPNNVQNADVAVSSIVHHSVSQLVDAMGSFAPHGAIASQFNAANDSQTTPLLAAAR